jgi:4-amino-4-deoxy-L-arabinose transferase-like glycosyltransferase
MAGAPPHGARRGWRSAALALLALALVARVAAVAATPGYVPHHDDRDFDRIACWVAQHGLPPDRSPRLPPRESCVTHGPAGRRTAYRPPLWPLLLGGSDVVARTVGIQRWTAGRLVQAVIGTAIAGLVGLIAAELCGAAVGLVALGLAAVFLPLILDGTTLISEPLFVALELAAVLAALKHGRSASGLRWAVAGGVLVGLASLTRLNGVVLALPLAVAMATRGSGRSLRAAAAFAVAVVLVIAPWTIRNAAVLGAFVPVSTETGPTLLGTYNPAARAAPGCTGCWVMLSKSPPEVGLADRLRPLGEARKDRAMRSIALRYARRHPGYVAQVAWGNSVRLLELGGAHRTRFAAGTIDVPPGAAVAGRWLLWLMLLAAAAGIAAGTLRRVPAWLLALPVLLWVTTVLVQSETPRLRAPLDPFILLLAAAGATIVARAG